MPDVLTEDMAREYFKKAPYIAMSDTHGNTLTIVMNGKVRLKLSSEGNRVRQIGYIVENTFYVDRKEDHLHRASQSLGFNFHILRYTNLFHYVNISYDGNNYLVPKDTIIQRGEILSFQNAADGNSFELQIFLRLEIIKAYIIKFQNNTDENI